MLAVAQFFRGYSEALRLDRLGRSPIVGHFDARDVGLPAGLHVNRLGPADHSLHCHAAQRDRRRQCGHLKLDRLHRFRPGFIHCPDGDGVAARRQLSRVQQEIQPVAKDHRADIRFQAQAGDWRLAQRDDAGADRVADHRVAGQPFNLQPRRYPLDFKGLLHRCRLPAGVGRPDTQGMFFRRQLEWIQVKVVGRFAIDLDHLAIDDELDLRDFGLPARVDRDDLGIDDFFLRCRLKVVGHTRRQGGNLKLRAQLTYIALDILNRDIQLILARLLRLRLDRVRLIGRDHFAVNGIFDALNILVGADLNRDLRIFGDGFGEDIIGQEKQRYRYRRAQRGLARGCLAIGGHHIQREVITLAIGGHIDAQADDVLAAEEKCQVAVNIAQLFGLGRIIKLGVGFSRNRFQETPVN